MMKMKFLFFVMAAMLAVAATAQTNKPATQYPATTSRPVLTTQRPATATQRPATATQRTATAAQRPNASAQTAQKKAAQTKATAMTPQQKAAAQKAAAQKAAQQRAAQQKMINDQFKEVEYTIVGKAHGFEPNEWVKLYNAGTMVSAFDSVQLNGEDFSFTGKTLSIPREIFLVTGEGAKKTMVEFFLEKGTINIDITASERTDKVTGTTHNNIYMPYRDSINVIYTDILACIQGYGNFKNSADDRESYKMGEKVLRDKLVATTYDFTLKNTNNWVGVYLFAQYFGRFTKKQNNAIIARMPQRFANTPAIKEIKAAVAKMK